MRVVSATFDYRDRSLRVSASGFEVVTPLLPMLGRFGDQQVEVLESIRARVEALVPHRAIRNELKILKQLKEP